MCVLMENKNNNQGISVNSHDDSGPKLDMQLPERFPVAVILESRPAKSQWVDTVWQAVALTIGNTTDENADQTFKYPRLIYFSGDIAQHLYSGLQVTLYKDQCESYYHNLIAPNPRCYVVAHVDDNEAPPEPFLITMSFDEAHAYLEGDDEVYDVDVPPELYRWTEAFVLIHYAPEKRIKRKRKNWTQQDSECTSI